VAEATLSGKVVLITGGAKRVGAAIARRLHASGASLMLHYHSAKSEAVELQRALNAARANSATCWSTTPRAFTRPRSARSSSPTGTT
jgi:pteridine reductase